MAIMSKRLDEGTEMDIIRLLNINDEGSWSSDGKEIVWHFCQIMIWKEILAKRMQVKIREKPLHMTKLQNEVTTHHSNINNVQADNSFQHGKKPIRQKVQNNVTTHRHSNNVQKANGIQQRKQSNLRYLLPLVVYGPEGPNSIYNSYRFAINYALQQNRSIVNVPIKMPDRLPGYRWFNDTFDAEMLSRVVPVKNLADFKRDCGSELPLKSLVLLRHRVVEDNLYWPNRRDFLEDLLGITLPKQENNHSFPVAVKQITASADTPCILVTLIDASRVYSTVKDFPSDYPKIDKHLIHTKDIRQFASSLVKQLCNGEQFAAFHWRNMGAESCGNINLDSIPCKGKKLIMTNIHYLTNLVYKYLQSKNINCVYVSSKKTGMDMAAELNKTRLVVYNSNSLKDGLLSVSTKLNVTIKDPYKLSLLEQEISIMESFGHNAMVQSSWIVLVPTRITIFWISTEQVCMYALISAALRPWRAVMKVMSTAKNGRKIEVQERVPFAPLLLTTTLTLIPAPQSPLTD
uniref:Uncharacterized protein LOC100368051 n=1 Tax=Saccoglossus kowalevskii TaxID=10224 RepID=A0ABM0GYB9_SACKO|nr:PREDICTED: uncharacterized protein LOC100368051 [Saccoglossus kowalevskii]